jgi:hypothetical protein
MKSMKRHCLFAIALAVVVVPLPATSFAELLASFPEISPPQSWVCDPYSWGRPSGPSISIDDFETFFLAPARSLAADRVGLRSQEEWESWLRTYEEAHLYPQSDYGVRLGFYPLGRWKDHGFLILAMYFHKEEQFFEGSDIGKKIALFSFTPSGRLIDGFSFLPPEAWGLKNSLVPDPPSFKGVLLDPVFHTGFPDKATIALDARNRIIAIDRYQIDRMVTEIGKREVGVSGNGTFIDLAPKRRFLLTRIFAERDGAPGLLYDYEPEEGGKDGSAFLIWKAEPDAEPFETELASGRAQGDADFADAAGVTHSLAIKYGPGKNGEATELAGVLALGDPNHRVYQNWTYLFAPTSLATVNGKGQVSYADRSLVLYAPHEFLPQAASEEGTEESTEDSRQEAAAGMPAGGLPWSLSGNSVSFAPRSFRFFQLNGVNAAGKLIMDFRLPWKGGSVLLPAGSFWYGPEDTGRGWAVPAKDSSITVNGSTISIPAGSTIRLVYSIPKSIAFAKPVTLKAGSASIVVYGAEFATEPSFRLSAASAAVPAALLVKGKTVAFTDTLLFDESGKLQGGRLQSNAEFVVGGMKLGLKGGFDMGNRDGGIVYFYKDGSVRSGYLSKAAIFLVGKSRLSLAPGDHVSFGQDGGLKSFTSDAILKIVSGGSTNYLSAEKLFSKPGIRAELLFCEPDGRIWKIAPDDTIAPAGASVSALIAACTNSGVRVRGGPYTEAEILGFLNSGDKLAVLAKTEERMKVEEMTDYWYQVRRLSDGLLGWCYGHYLKLEE